MTEQTMAGAGGVWNKVQAAFNFNGSNQCIIKFKLSIFSIWKIQTTKWANIVKSENTGAIMTKMVSQRQKPEMFNLPH